jgi:hypothetical protein
MTAGPARCLYALRPAERPGCQLTATVTYGGIALCSACHTQRSTLGKGQAGRRLPVTEPDPIALLADARLNLIDAQEQLQAAVIRARQTSHHLGRHSQRGGHHKASRSTALHPALTSIGASFP